MKTLVVMLARMYGLKVVIEVLKFYSTRSDNFIDDHVVSIVEKLYNNNFKIENELQKLKEIADKKLGK